MTAAAGGDSQNPNAAGVGGGTAGAGNQGNQETQGSQGSQGSQGGQGSPGSAPKWDETLDPELRDSPSVKKFKGTTWDEVGPVLFKSYHNLERWQIPGENATPEERAAFHRRLGVPEKVEEYSAALKPEVPEGVPWSPEIQAAFAQFAHAEGIPPATATKILNFYLSRAGQGVDMQKTATAESLRQHHERLKQRWGANYQRNVGLVHRVVEEWGKPEFAEMLDTVVMKGPDGSDIALGNHPAMLEFLANYGEQRLEAGFIPGNSLLVTKDAAEQELRSILDNPGDAYWQGDKSRIRRVQELLAITDAPKAAR